LSIFKMTIESQSAPAPLPIALDKARGRYAHNFDWNATYWIHQLSQAEQYNLSLETIVTAIAAENKMLEALKTLSQKFMFILYSLARRATTCAC